MMSSKMQYCGRKFTTSQMNKLKRIIADNPDANRYKLSQLVCKKLRWLRPDGRLKDMSCRVAMIRMHKDGLIQLPEPRHSHNNGKPYRRRTAQAEPELFPFDVPAGDILDLQLQPVVASKDSHLWNEYIDRYHYLGYKPLPGAQLRYFARAENRILALFGFGAAAWKTAPRDRFIGWNVTQRENRLHLVVNNARFLILPWVNSRNLASRLLAMACRQLADDWEERYAYRPTLVETFVETPRFRGTCYKAANWTYLGETKGRGKLDVHHQALLPKKAIWIYPLVRDFRRILCV